MGNESSKKAYGGKRASDESMKKPRAGAKHVHIDPRENDKKSKGKQRMEQLESASTFGQATGQIHLRRGPSPVMITDALSDVRINYHIDPKELGHGHYGVVRKCMHRETGNLYAIKSIRKSKVNKIEVLKREIEILKEVKHPHIIELFDVYEDERYLHLITELCTGGELFDRIIAKTQSAEGHFSEHDAARLVRDILDAIRYCHDEKQIVHRDLKPENFLFLTPSEESPIKIIDFGLSRHDDAHQGIMQTKVGTPYYVAPEVLRREYTKKCDIWSIGVITYILLCGYPPFYGDSDTQIFESVKIGKFDFPSPEWDDISANAKAFVMEMLQKDPERRPEAFQALQHKWLIEELGEMVPSTLRPSTRSHASLRTGEFANYLAMKKLQKAALGYIATNLTHAEVGKLEELFKTLDRTGSGTISLTELDEAIAQGNFCESVLSEIRSLRQDLELSDESKLNYRDFVAMTMDRSLALREDNMRDAFEHFRHSEADYLTVRDLEDIFGEVQAQDVMNILDTDGDGRVSFEDFNNAIVKSMAKDEHPSIC